jgi:hypothetical protein
LHDHNRWITGTVQGHTITGLAVCGYRNIVFWKDDAIQVYHTEEAAYSICWRPLQQMSAYLSKYKKNKKNEDDCKEEWKKQ